MPWYYSWIYVWNLISCRTILAAVHFNSNLRRESEKDAEGKTKFRVVYPKFKDAKQLFERLKLNQVMVSNIS